MIPSENILKAESLYRTFGENIRITSLKNPTPCKLPPTAKEFSPLRYSYVFSASIIKML